MQQRRVCASERRHFEQVLIANGDNPRDFEIDESTPIYGTGNIAIMVRNKRNGKEAGFSAGPGTSWAPEFEHKLKAGAFN